MAKCSPGYKLREASVSSEYTSGCFKYYFLIYPKHETNAHWFDSFDQDIQKCCSVISSSDSYTPDPLLSSGSLPCEPTLIFTPKFRVTKIPYHTELPWWPRSERIHLQCGRPGFDPWIGKSPWRRAWQPTPVLLFGESPWTEEPDGLQCMESQRVRYDSATKHTYCTTEYTSYSVGDAVLTKLHI